MNTTTNPKSLPIEDRTSRRQKLMASLYRNIGGDMESVTLWLTSPHPDLDNRAPQSFMDEGKIEVVESLAWAIEHYLFG